MSRPPLTAQNSHHRERDPRFHRQTGEEGDRQRAGPQAVEQREAEGMAQRLGVRRQRALQHLLAVERAPSGPRGRRRTAGPDAPGRATSAASTRAISSAPTSVDAAAPADCSASRRTRSRSRRAARSSGSLARVPGRRHRPSAPGSTNPAPARRSPRCAIAYIASVRLCTSSAAKAAQRCDSDRRSGHAQSPRHRLVRLAWRHPPPAPLGLLVRDAQVVMRSRAVCRASGSRHAPAGLGPGTRPAGRCGLPARPAMRPAWCANRCCSRMEPIAFPRSPARPSGCLLPPDRTTTAGASACARTASKASSPDHAGHAQVEHVDDDL